MTTSSSCRSIYPAGFTPRFVGETEEIYATIGYKGEASSGLRYDFSVSSSRNTLALSMYNSISPSYGAESQTSFEFGDLIQEELDANIDLSYEIDAGLASALTLSGGLEYRERNLRGDRRRPAVLRRRALRHAASALCRDGAGFGRVYRYRNVHGRGHAVGERLRRHEPDVCGQRQRGQLWRLRRPRSRPDGAG